MTPSNDPKAVAFLRLSDGIREIYAKADAEAWTLVKLAAQGMEAQGSGGARGLEAKSTH